MYTQFCPVERMMNSREMIKQNVYGQRICWIAMVVAVITMFLLLMMFD